MDYRASFSGFNEASAEDRRPSLYGFDGNHRFQVESHQLINNDQGMTLIANVAVLSSDNPAVPAGFRTSIVIGGLRESVGWKRSKALGRVKAHLAAVFSLPAQTNTDWIGIIQLCCEKNVAEGATFCAQTQGYTYTNDKAKECTGCNFNHFTDPENPLPNDARFAGFYAAKAS